MANTAFADDEQLVSPGGTYTYNVAQTNGNATLAVYHWSISGGLPADYTDITAQTGSSVSIKWNTPGSYTISVYVVDGTGCQSETVTRLVTVADTKLCLNAAGATNKQTCSLITTGNGNTSSTTWTPATPGDTKFDLDITNPALTGTYTIHYNATDGINPTGDLTTTVAVTASTTATKAITISHATYVNLFTNLGATAKNVTITVTKIVDPNSLDITANCGTTSYTVSVAPRPLIAF